MLFVQMPKTIMGGKIDPYTTILIPLRSVDAIEITDHGADFVTIDGKKYEVLTGNFYDALIDIESNGKSIECLIYEG